MLEAVSRLGDPHLRVLVVGSFRHDPRYRERLLDRYGPRLILMGPHPHTEMPLFLAAADVVVLPQRPTRATMAQVPGKVFEAMAMARPVVATAVSDLPEILDGCGVIVLPGSTEERGHALERLLTDTENARALSREARRRCEQYYSWDARERILDEKLGHWTREASVAHT